MPRGEGVVKYWYGASWEKPNREKTPANVRKLQNLASKLRPFVLLDKFEIVPLVAHFLIATMTAWLVGSSAVCRV